MFSGYHTIIGIVAGILAFSSYIFYIYAILQGETRPNRASWWVWAILGSVVFLSYYFSGARDTIWAPLSEALGPIIVAFLSIKYGEGGWTLFDRRCLLGVGISLFLWLVYGSPKVALLSSLSVDFFAALPTIRKSYLRPEGENITAWLLVIFANIMNILAIERWTFAIAVHPLYMTFITSSILVALFFPMQRYEKKKKSVVMV